VFQYPCGVTSEQQPVGDARDRLGAALRALGDAAVRTGASADELDDVAAMLEAFAARLQAAGSASHVHDSPYHPMSLVGGTAHPWAPQLQVARSADGVTGTVVLGPAHEGGPGLAHGGVLSLLFDHAMGQALFSAGYSAMTVSLAVRYQAPTPLGVPLVVRAGLGRAEGRKLFVMAEVSAAGQVSARAEGVFVQLTADNVARIFPANRVPSGPPPGA
jgi:acyl-coenzyme A thioesterase PaaI-like protein